MASRFWVGGTGTWDAADTTHWAATSGGAGGQSVPGSADTATLDGSSGGGTVTVNTTVTVQSVTCGAFTGTLDFSANNNNVNLSVSFNGSGTATRTINLGNGTWTLSGASGTPWFMQTVTNLTFNANSSTIVYSGVPTALVNFAGGGLTYSTLTFNANTNRSGMLFAQSNTIGTLNVSAPNVILFSNGTTTTITNGFTLSGTSANPIALLSGSTSAIATLSLGGTCTIAYGAVRAITKSGAGSLTVTNGFDLGLNTSVTVTGPSSGSGISRARAASGF